MTNEALSRARSYLITLQQKLGPRSPRFAAFLNLLRSYYDIQNNDINHVVAIARRLKELLKGYDCLEQELELFLCDEFLLADGMAECDGLIIAELSDDDDESDVMHQDENMFDSVNDNKVEDSNNDAYAIDSDVEIEEEYDVNIYEDYDVIEMSDSESEYEESSGAGLQNEIARGGELDVSVGEQIVATQNTAGGKTSRIDVIRTGKRGRPRHAAISIHPKWSGEKASKPESQITAREQRSLKRARQPLWVVGLIAKSVHN